MLSLVKKEINSFLSSLIGYIVICVFLLTVSLFLWVFTDTGFNIPDSGYANLDGLFTVAPWVFMFLIPAVTMRSFAEEKRTGTIELLLTRPLTDMQIVLSKYIAGFVVVLFSLLPTLIYIVSIYRLATPVGNIDFGGMWGSYIGLLFLASGFVAAGIFASSISDNQIISFILGMFICFFCYIGFQSVSALSLPGYITNAIQSIGIRTHYVSMSRGVLDTRDILYFLSFSAVFMLCTRAVLENRNR